MSLPIWSGVQTFLGISVSLFGADHVWFEDALGQGRKLSLDCCQKPEVGTNSVPSLQINDLIIDRSSKRSYVFISVRSQVRTKSKEMNTR